MSYQDDPFRKNGRKKVFYKGRRNNESDALSTTNTVGEAAEEKEGELPLYKDTAFLQEEVEEEDIPLEQDENQETEGSLWDFKIPPSLAKEERPVVKTEEKAEALLSPATEALLQEAFQKMEAIQEEEKKQAVRRGEESQSSKAAAGLSEEQERLALAMLSAILPEEESSIVEETAPKKTLSMEREESLEPEILSGRGGSMPDFGMVLNAVHKADGRDTEEKRENFGNPESPAPKTVEKTEKAEVDGKEVNVKSWSFPKNEE